MDSPVLPTNIPDLDPLVGGGLPTRGIVFLAGPPGGGKTVLALQLVFGVAQQGHNALYFSGLSEPHDRLIEHLRGLAWWRRKPATR